MGLEVKYQKQESYTPAVGRTRVAGTKTCLSLYILYKSIICHDMLLKSWWSVFIFIFCWYINRVASIHYLFIVNIMNIIGWNLRFKRMKDAYRIGLSKYCTDRALEILLKVIKTTNGFFQKWHLNKFQNWEGWGM